jgi:hypothetical protein
MLTHLLVDFDNLIIAIETNVQLVFDQISNKLGLNMSIGILNNVKCYQSIHNFFITEQCMLDVYF